MGNGWWNHTQQGWFFKKEHYDEIISYGAKAYFRPEILEFVEPYGRGYIYKPNKDHPSYGTKKYKNGWWKRGLNSWFFKTEFIDIDTLTIL